MPTAGSCGSRQEWWCRSQKLSGPGSVIVERLRLMSKTNTTTRSIEHFTTSYQGSGHVQPTGLYVCACWSDRSTQVFSRRPPRYHQSLSLSFIKHSSCTRACMPHPCPSFFSNSSLFCLPFYAAVSLAFLPWGPSKRNPLEERGDADFVHPWGACWCSQQKEKR